MAKTKKMKVKLRSTVADHRQLQQLGFPKKAAKKAARSHNRQIVARQVKAMRQAESSLRGITLPGQPAKLKATPATLSADGAPVDDMFT
jgi:hypothetical protein